MFSMPVGMSAGQVPVRSRPARPTGRPDKSAGLDLVTVVDVLADVDAAGDVAVWRAVDRLAELAARPGRVRGPVERRCDVERHADRREARRVLRAVAGGLVPALDIQAVAVTEAPPVEARAVEALVVCEACRRVPGVRRVVFVDAVLALVCRCCAAGAVAGVAA